jgi:ABC-type sugar transport system substrate-binding protein
MDPADPRLAAIKAGMASAASTYGKQTNTVSSVKIQTPDKPEATSLAQLLDALAQRQDIDLVAVYLPQPRQQTEALKRLKATGKPVITIGRSAATCAGLPHVGLDNEGMGRMGVVTLNKARSHFQKKVVVLTGDLTLPEQKARLQGLKSALEAFPQMTLYRVLEAPETPHGARAHLMMWLEQQDRDNETDCFVFLGPWALESAAPLPWPAQQYAAVGFGASPSMLTHLQRGHVAALLAPPYFQWGEAAAQIGLKQLHENMSPAPEPYKLPYDVLQLPQIEPMLGRWRQWLN